MKLNLFIALVVLFIPAIHAQKSTKLSTDIVQASNEAGRLIAASANTVGTVKDIHVILIRQDNFNNAGVTNTIRIELRNKSRYTNTARTDLTAGTEFEETAGAMKEIINKVFADTSANKTEYHLKTATGMVTGAYHIAANTKPQTRLQRTYVETEAKMFEGKTVYKDDKGSFIWKPVIEVPASLASWTAYLQVEKNVPSSRVLLTVNEYKVLLALIEKAISGS
jgi:hypothetical protein